MNTKPFAPKFEDLPEILPIFPLTGVLLLPGGKLPLNIFEQRYIDMIDAALRSHRMIGMIQPETPNRDGAQDAPKLYNVGCAGKITDFQETEDGCYLITLRGLCRFHVDQELDQSGSFRQIRPQWDMFKNDLQHTTCLDLDRSALHDMLDTYFINTGLGCDWDKIDSANDSDLITCLSMVCPFEPQEKQALLEKKCCFERAALFMQILEMTLKTANTDRPDTQH